MSCFLCVYSSVYILFTVLWMRNPRRANTIYSI